MAIAKEQTRGELVSYAQAARILGVQPKYVGELVSRGHLHSIPNPQDRRRRCLYRQEVEARARFTAEHSRGVKPAYYRRPAPDPLTIPSLADLLGVEPEKVIAGEAGAAVLIALALLALGGKSSGLVTGLALVGIAALGAAIIAELAAQKRITEKERLRLEALAREAEAAPAQFITELRPYLVPSPGQASQAS